jgi:tetratricopeptide (TPR) repeat protein
LGEIYFEESNWPKAVAAYEKVIDSDNEYTEKALVRSAMALVNDDKKANAIPIWQRLETGANFKENKRYAEFNLMKAYYEAGNYTQSVAQSEKVLSLSNVSAKVKWDAYDMLAHSSLILKDSAKAKQAFIALEKAPTDALAAEALYFKAYLLHQEGAFEKSNATIAVIAQKYSSAGEWSAKSLLLMAQNFEQLEDAFQALFILDSIIENFKQYTTIVTQAQDLKKAIKKKEAEKNESIENGNN